MSSELGQRFAFTLGALLICGRGRIIRLPGTDLSDFEPSFGKLGGYRQ